MKYITILILGFLMIFLVSCNGKMVYEDWYNENNNDTYNIFYEGKIASQGDTVYFSLSSPGYEGLYRKNKDGMDKKLIKSGNISNIINIGNTIFYIKTISKLVSIPIIKENPTIAINILYRSDSNGKNEEKISENCYCVNIKDNKVYYVYLVDVYGYEKAGLEVPDSEKIGDIYCMDLKSGSLEKLIEGGYRYFLIGDSILYLKEINGQYKINKYDINSKNQKPLIVEENEIYNFCLSNNNIIYAVCESIGDDRYEYKLYRTDLEGNNKTFIAKEGDYNEDERFDILLIYKDKIYYGVEASSIFCMNIDGTKKQKIEVNKIINLSILNDGLYYMDIYNNIYKLQEYYLT